ncbi:MAG TPA: type I-E CRISPR-associated protein Cas7/Cse4/CasC [Bryobacteraceae bacterium]|nr:type I-E CRISPR-associated protein Cas7/Cse4/CasC [Bryobacteraceae bacterium]
MFVEIHTIQNFAPSNLNRDDTGSPKDCEFGGHRRARVSSQCWKRAVREYFSQEALLPEAQRAVRTKKLVGTLAERLVGLDGKRTLEDAVAVGAAAVQALGVGLDAKSKEEKKTSVLLFLGHDQIDALTGLCQENWDGLLADTKKKTSALPKDVISRLKNCLQGSRAVDLALFGRMIAEDPVQNVDAACQVAHALSTHRVAPEFDYYTAVDDLGRDDETGAGMVGTQEFNSACFYRYANIDLNQLTTNLQDDEELALSGVRAFLRSFIMAIPKAKQNSTAALSLPSYVMIVVRDSNPTSLANAFAKPVDGRGHGLVVNSVDALVDYRNRLEGMYGSGGIRSAVYATTEAARLDTPDSNPAVKLQSVEELLARTMETLGGAR